MEYSSIEFYKVKLVRERSVEYKSESTIVSTPDAAYKAILELTHADEEAVEVLGILALTTKNNIAGVHIISMGTINSSIASPREIFKPAILNNATGIILFHNHPSGDPTPSNEDIQVTETMIKVGKLLGIPVRDHLVIGHCRYHSMKREDTANFNMRLEENLWPIKES